MEPSALEWHRSVTTLLDSSHMAEPSELLDVANQAIRPTGAEVTAYLIDREQVALRPLPRTGLPTRDPLPVETTVAGRAFSQTEVVVPPNQPDRLWVPILDGSDRLGVVEVVLPAGLSADDPHVREGAERLTSAIGYVLVAKNSYGDTIRRARRSRTMSVGGELLWRALPPLSFSTPWFSLAAALEPCYEVGGDAFDYAVDHHRLRLGIFDAIGHGLWAALTSTLTLAATRAARAAGSDLTAMAATADEAITSQFGDSRYTTAILAEIDGATGVMQYVNAGHPPAVVIREGKAVTVLDATPRPPLGVSGPAEVSEHALQPGDRLLFYTDGITEARDADGEFFGVSRLIELAEHHAASGLSTAETVRRLSRSVLAKQPDGDLADDATLMIVEWMPGGR